jgi:hypothetical protein
MILRDHEKDTFTRLRTLRRQVEGLWRDALSLYRQKSQ